MCKAAWSDRVYSCWGCWKTDWEEPVSTSLPAYMTPMRSQYSPPAPNHGKSAAEPFPVRSIVALVPVISGQQPSHQTGGGFICNNQLGVEEGGSDRYPLPHSSTKLVRVLTQRLAGILTVSRVASAFSSLAAKITGVGGSTVFRYSVLIVIKGLRRVIGSWKTSATASPRNCRNWAGLRSKPTVPQTSPVLQFGWQQPHVAPSECGFATTRFPYQSQPFTRLRG